MATKAELERAREIKRLLQEGKTVEEIAASMGLTEAAIRYHRRRLFGKSEKFLSEAEKQTILELHEQGLGEKRIAKVVGRPHQTVRNVIMRAKAQEPQDWVDMLRDTSAYWWRMLESLRLLQVGGQYNLHFRRPEQHETEWPYCIKRPMVYEGTVLGKKPKLIFRSTAGGWRESFTLQQVRDRIIEVVK